MKRKKIKKKKTKRKNNPRILHTTPPWTMKGKQVQQANTPQYGQNPPKLIANFIGKRSIQQKIAKKNAERTVQCVNACEKIDSESFIANPEIINAMINLAYDVADRTESYVCYNEHMGLNNCFFYKSESKMSDWCINCISFYAYEIVRVLEVNND